MEITSFIFRNTFEVKADYGTLATSMKSKLNEIYFKGYIDRDETQLFYYSGAFRRPLSTSLPIVQVNFANRTNDNGKTVVKFKIVDFMLILFGLANVSILTASLLKVDPRITLVIPLITATISYGFLLFMYLIELSGFERELRRMGFGKQTTANTI